MKDFDYALPQDRIALFPLEKRDASKLLLWENGTISDDTYGNIARHLPTNAHLIFNNTKVIAARLFFSKATGGRIEVFLLEPADGDYKSLYSKKKSDWKCLVGGLKKWKNDEILRATCEVNGRYINVNALLLEKQEDTCNIQFTWDDNEAVFSDIIATAGKIPLPPYIKRQCDAIDNERYQTVYAKQSGSVAAPTAGLHFTEKIFNDFEQKRIGHSFVTLHVGAGTFKPVTANNIADHNMHQEYFEAELSLIEKLANPEKMIIAVGTTSLRTLESLYWIGYKIIKGDINAKSELMLSQWEHAEWDETSLPSRQEVMLALKKYMNENHKPIIQGHTGICITPGYSFRVASGLITNFHQPQSTLLLLIAAILGDDWKKVYKHALENEYRFLSYGDGSLLFMKQS